MHKVLEHYARTQTSSTGHRTGIRWCVSARTAGTGRMTDSATIIDPRSPAQDAATQTHRRAKGLRLAADSAVTARNWTRPRQAFDAGTLGPQDPAEEFRRLQLLDADEALAWVERNNGADGKSQGYRKVCRSSTRDILHWLLSFPGDTWDERWFASGLDQAPRTGLDELSRRLSRPTQHVSLGMTSLVRARLVRPSYEWSSPRSSGTAAPGRSRSLTLPNPRKRGGCGIFLRTVPRTSLPAGTLRTRSRRSWPGPANGSANSPVKTSSPTHTPHA